MNIEKFLILDHHLGSNKLSLCRVIGEVYSESDISITLRHWACCDIDTGQDINDDNDEVLTIIKSSIVYRYRAVEWIQIKM